MVLGSWCFSLVGCRATPPNLPAAATYLTGIHNGIAFHTPEPPDLAPPTTPTLTEERSVRLALTHSPKLQSALAHVRAAEADADQARLLPNPILGLDVRFPTKSGSNTVFEPTLAEDLVGILQKPNTIKAADNRLRAAAADALTTALDVIAETQTAYAAARAADAALASADQRHQILQHLRDIAQKRLAAGDATRLDVLTLDTQLLQSSLDLADLRLTRTEQRLTLARLIGSPRAAADWTLPDNTPDAQPPAQPDESAWIDAALLNRPEITSKVWELRALGDDLDATTFAPFQGAELGVHGEHDPDWRVGPTLTTPLPLFDFGQSARAKADAQRQAARHDLTQQQRDVIQEIRLAYATYQQAAQTLTQARTKLQPLQQQQLDQAQLAYQAGEADLATLLLAETDYQTTAVKIIDLQQRLATARIKLHRAAGGAAVASRLSERGVAASATTNSAPNPAAGPATHPAPLPTGSLP